LSGFDLLPWGAEAVKQSASGVHGKVDLPLELQEFRGVIGN
jgi:hypothetical protein